MSAEVTAVALYDYNATDSDELSVRKGETLVLLESYDDGWWLMQKGRAAGLVPSNYMETKNSALPEQHREDSEEPRSRNPSGDRQQHKKDKKVDKKTQPELAQLKTLRDEAESKLNKLSMAIENSHHEDVRTHGEFSGQEHHHAKNRTSHDEKHEHKNTTAHSTAMVPAAQSQALVKQIIPKGNLQQVSLDPNSLKFISDIITERINHEFAVRDGRLMDKVKNMITSSTAPNSSNMLRYDGATGHNQSQDGNPETPHRLRSFSTSSGPHLGGHQSHHQSAEDAMSISMLSKASLGSHPSRIPVRVQLPKVASAVDGRAADAHHGAADGYFHGQPKAPPGARNLHSHAPAPVPARRPSLGNESRFPPVGQQPGAHGRVGKAHSCDEGEAGMVAPSPAPHSQHAVQSAIVEPVLDGFQYPHCRSKVYGPSYPVEAPDALPGAKLVLHHVYGYDGDINRHGAAVRGKNVLWADARRVIYPAAAVVVVQEVAGDRRQGFFCGHSDDVTCVAVHPQRTVAASGQMGKDCSVLVWDINKVKRGQSLNRHTAKLKPPTGMRGICAVDFSGDGRLLLAVGLDESRLLIVFDWKESTIVATAKVGHSDLNQIRFNPFLFSPPQDAVPVQASAGSQKAEPSCKSCYTLVSFGGKNIKFWTLREVLTKDDGGLESISTFKGRPLNKRKGEQHSVFKYVLEGNLGVLPSHKNGPIPEITSMVMVNDCMETNHFSRGFVESTPKSRIFFGTSAGSVFIWQQSEDDQFRSSLEKVNNGGIAGAPMMAWQPRGKLLSVVMELHDSPIIDMDYIRVPPPESEHATPPQQKHQSRVGVVENHTERIITSSADGIVNVWLLNRHETSNALPLDHLGYLELNKEYARSTSWDPTGSAAILGTAENSVLLLNYEEEHVAPEKTGNARKVTTEDLIRPKIAIDVVTQCHNGKVRKVAVNSVIPSIVATISSEKVVRVWDLRERTLLSSFELAEPATAVAFAPDGGEITLGTEKGDLLVYTCRALRELAQSFPCAFTANDFSEAEWNVSFRRSLASKNTSAHEGGTPNKKKHAKKAEVCEISFSAAGDTVAVGCKNNLIHLLSVSAGYKHTAVCRGHSSHVRAIDFSTDGSVLQTCDATRELMHWETSTGKRLLNAAQFRDTVWSTYNCLYGWSVQGVFNNSEGVAAVDGDINCVDRSADARWLVTGGSHTVHNAIKLFNYPCLQDAVPSLYGGHTSPVVDVKMLTGVDGTLEVVSAGGNDSCMFQWRLLEYK